jgi:hypothetical protein
MTSGPGDNQPGGEYGPRQEWTAPPSPPPGQYPGFHPAPAAPGGYGAPPAMERPATVRFGIGAFVASLILGVISSILTFADIDEIVARSLAQSGTDVQVSEATVRSLVVVSGVVALVFVALEVLFLLFAWKGRNWARIVLWVLGGLGVAFGLLGLAGDSAVDGFLEAIGFCQLLLTAAGIVLLALKPSNEWFRYRGWQRATAQR